MNNLNSILIEGKVSSEIELSYTPQGTAVCTFSLASDRFQKTGETTEKETSIFPIETRLRLAEICAKYLKKGRGVRVVGRLKQETVEGVSRVWIVAEHVEFRPETKDAKGA
jgi:single-strand DNA-binding protein